MKVYNKLVRDKIPDIMIKNGATPITRVLEDLEFLNELNRKLEEEVKEYLESGEIEEIADITEVILAIMDHKNVSMEELDNIREEKVLKRGAFKQKIFLEREE